jgi:hypothetical protein
VTLTEAIEANTAARDENTAAINALVADMREWREAMLEKLDAENPEPPF